MSYRDVMNVVLPPTVGTSVHITGHYGEMRAKGPHGGSDFNYAGGQSGINLTHPTVHSPVSGEVVFVGGQYGTVTVRDAEGNEHKILHMNTQTVRMHQRIEAGDQIGTMGGRGPQGANQYAQHVHYQMKDSNGHAVNPEQFWNSRSLEQGAAATPRRIDQNLEQGDSGPEVHHIQQALDRLGYRDAHGNALAVDGDFGARSREAVIAFQQAHGLHVDGVVGPRTRDALHEAGQRPLLSERTHTDHALFREAREGMQQLPSGTFRNSVEMDNASANVALKAKQSGISHIDHVMMNTRGDGLIAVQGNLHNPARHFVSVDKAQAASQSVEQSTIQLAQHAVAHQQGSQIAQAHAQMENVEHRAGLSMGVRP
jgi:putative chitinase